MNILEGKKRLNKIFFLTFIILMFTSKTEVFAKGFFNYLNGGSISFFYMPCMSNVYMEAYEVSLKDNFIGYIESEEKLQRVMDEVKKIYINKASEKGILVKKIDFNNKVDLKNKIIQSKELNTKDELVSKILTLNRVLERPLLDIVIEGEIFEKVSIEPDLEVIKLEDKFLGENTVYEGIEGEKEVTKKITLINNKEIKNEIISEKVIKEAKAKKVYKGVKNPILEKMPFLSHPTRGGVITSVFGEKSRGGHRGVDIAVPSGTEIGATYDGIVTFVGYDEIYGNMVKIKHDNNIETLYAHAKTILTEKGKKVKKGETIALVGSTGRSTGPHLHLELIYDGKPYNPMDYIKQP